MRLEPLLTPDLTLVIEGCSTRDAALQAAAARAAGHLTNITPEQLFQQLLEREAQYPTATPEGVAFPHALIPGLDHTTVVACLLRPAVEWAEGAPAPQDLMFMMIGKDDHPWEHVRLLARLARIVKSPDARRQLRESADAADFHARLVREDRAHV